MTTKPSERGRKIERLTLHVTFGTKEVTLTDAHNLFVPYYNKINEIIDYLNSHDPKQ